MLEASLDLKASRSISSNWMGSQSGKRLVLARCPPDCVLILLAAGEGITSPLPESAPWSQADDLLLHFGGW